MNDNQIVEKIISVLTQGVAISHKKGMVNFTQIYLKQIELAGLTLDQWNHGTGLLMVGKYLIPTSEEIMKKSLEDEGIFDAMFHEVINRKLSDSERQKVIDSLEKTEKNFTSLTTESGQKNITGEIINSGPVGVYKILKDLRRLREDILNNKFDVKYIAQNIRYDEETKVLSFRNMDIDMQPTSKPNKHSKILSFFNHNSFDEQYSFSSIWESDYFDGYRKENDSEKNIGIYLEQLHNRILDVTTKKNNPISDFLVITEQNKKKYVQINPIYTS